MAQLPAATHRPPSLPSNQECAQCVNREPELAIVTSRGYDPRQSPGPGYKRVVSCKGSSHGTDVLAVSEHGAPGRRPNIHAQFVGRQTEDGLDTLPTRAAEADRSTLIADIPFPAPGNVAAKRSPPPWRSVSFGPGSDEMAGDAVRRRHRAQCNGLRADGLRKWAAAAQATASENVDGARHLAGEHDTRMPPIGVRHRDGGEQRLRIRMQGPREQLGGASRRCHPYHSPLRLR